MSSRPSWPTIDVRPEPDRRLGYVIVAAALLAAAIIPWIPLAPHWQFAILMGVVVYAVLQARRFVLLKGRRVIQRAIWHGDGRWDIELADHSRQTVELAGSSFVSVPLILLHFRAVGGFFQPRTLLMLCNANCGAETLRALRVRLRLDSGISSGRNSGGQDN